MHVCVCRAMEAFLVLLLKCCCCCSIIINYFHITALEQCTAGDDGSVGIISCMSIFSACFGLLTSVQLAATQCTLQISIYGWILPDFEVSKNHFCSLKLKELQIFFWQHIFFYDPMLSKCVAHSALYCTVSTRPRTGKLKSSDWVLPVGTLFLS